MLFAQRCHDPVGQVKPIFKYDQLEYNLDISRAWFLTFMPQILFTPNLSRGGAITFHATLYIPPKCSICSVISEVYLFQMHLFADKIESMRIAFSCYILHELNHFQNIPIGSQ